MLILLLIEVNIVIEKKSYKENLIKTFNFSNSKIIYMLLI